MSARSLSTDLRPGRRDILPLPLPPRGLSRVEAARYVGISPTLFDQMVGDCRMPKPKRINARKVWDRLELDESFVMLPSEGEADSNSALDRILGLGNENQAA